MSQWNDEYYEIIDFYFWEPQHIGRSKTEKSRYKNMEDVKNHILNMEVSLNHQLNIFFRLAPEDFINKLVKNYFHNSFDDKYLFHGENEWKQYVPAEETQPDLFLSGESTNLAIELKLGAKSNMEQVAKYLLLHQLNNQSYNKEKQPYLLYISPSSFSSLWAEKFKSKSELISCFKENNFTKLKEKTKNNISESTWDSALNLIDEVEIEAITYKQFHELLIKYRDNIDMTQKYSDTIDSLFLGLINELESRSATKVGT